MTAPAVTTGMVASYPTRSEAVLWRSFWSAQLRRLPEGKGYGVIIRRIPGSKFYGVFVEPLS